MALKNTRSATSRVISYLAHPVRVFLFLSLILHGIYQLFFFPIHRYPHLSERYLHVVSLANHLVTGQRAHVPASYIAAGKIIYHKQGWYGSQVRYRHQGYTKKVIKKRIKQQVNAAKKLCKQRRYAFSRLACYSDSPLWRDAEKIDLPYRAIFTGDTYPAIGYLGFVAGMSLGMVLDIPPPMTVYLSTGTNVVLLILLGALILHVIPYLKWPMAGLLLFPSLAMQTILFMPDGWLIESSLLFIALIVRFRNAPVMDTAKKTMLLTLGVIVSLIKIVYFLFPMLLLLLPALQFKRPVRRPLFAVLCTLIAFLCSAGWVYHVGQNHPQASVERILNEDSSTRGYNRIKKGRLLQLYHSPATFLKVVANHFTLIRAQKSFYKNMMYWNMLGNPWKTYIYQGHYLWVPLLLVLMLVLARMENTVAPGNYPMTPADKAVISAVLLGMILCISLAVYSVHGYKYYDDGSIVIKAFQGRYFIPLIPLVWLLFIKNSPERNKTSQSVYRLLVGVMMVLITLSHVPNFYSL